ncbi:hypothetical protein EON64_04970, partial [archaeon]
MYMHREVRCTNYTWTSRMYYSDQIVISSDAPCSAVLNNMLVDESCNPDTAFRPAAHQPVYINVYGYSASKFAILAAPTGLTSNLLAGQPQASITSPAFICSERTESTGACDSRSLQRRAQIAYFSFRVSKTTPPPNVVDMSAMYNVLLTVTPNSRCNSTASNSSALPTSDCAPGCACNPLRVFVASCLESSCTHKDRKPSELSASSRVAQLTVQADSGSTLLVS